MAIAYNPYTLGNENLVVCFDAANPNSYPGSGSVWYNIGSNGGFVTGQTYMPEYTTISGVTCFNFNQVGAWFQNNSFFTSSFPSNRTNLTIDVWFYPAISELSSGDRGNLIRAVNGNGFYMSWNKSNQLQSNYWYSKTNEGYHESGSTITRGTWNNVVAVWNADSLSQFLNGTKTTAVTSGTTANATSGIQIGWEGDERQFSGGIAVIKMYDAALSDIQVTNNFNTLRGRFKI